MPMIDIYAALGTFSDSRKLAADAAAIVKAVEQVPDIPMFQKNTAAFVHEMPAGAIANVDGEGNLVTPHKAQVSGTAIFRPEPLREGQMQFRKFRPRLTDCEVRF
jgi:hypothetical protein